MVSFIMIIDIWGDLCSLGNIIELIHYMILSGYKHAFIFHSSINMSLIPQRNIDFWKKHKHFVNPLIEECGNKVDWDMILRLWKHMGCKPPWDLSWKLMIKRCIKVILRHSKYIIPMHCIASFAFLFLFVNVYLVFPYIHLCVAIHIFCYTCRTIRRCNMNYHWELFSM